MNATLPSYNELAKALSKAQLEFHPAQVHGLICGFICADPDKQDDDRWEKLITGAKKNRTLHELLQQLYEISYHQISEFSFEFSLLLPDDSIDITVRSEALGLWCQGFLTGLQHTGFSIEKHASETLTDALNDIIEIAQVNYDETSSSEEDENAYFELEEHVRLIVLMVYQEHSNPNSEEL